MTQAEKTYSFKPALLRKAKSFQVLDKSLEIIESNGETTVIELSEMTGLRYNVMGARNYEFRRLDIFYDRGETFHISLTLPQGEIVEHNSDLRSFYQFTHNFIEQLKQTNPDLSVVIGEPSRIRWVYFIIGALSFLAGIGLLGLAIMTGVSSQKLMKALFPMLGLSGFGLFLCYANKPWQKIPEIDLKVFGQMIDGLLREGKRT